MLSRGVHRGRLCSGPCSATDFSLYLATQACVDLEGSHINDTVWIKNQTEHKLMADRAEAFHLFPKVHRSGPELRDRIQCLPVNSFTKFRQLNGRLRLVIRNFFSSFFLFFQKRNARTRSVHVENSSKMPRKPSYSSNSLPQRLF